MGALAWTFARVKDVRACVSRRLHPAKVLRCPSGTGPSRSDRSPESFLKSQCITQVGSHLAVVQVACTQSHSAQVGYAIRVRRVLVNLQLGEGGLVRTSVAWDGVELWENCQDVLSWPILSTDALPRWSEKEEAFHANIFGADPALFNRLDVQELPCSWQSIITM